MFNLTDRHERLGFDSRCSAKLTDVLNGNEVFEANGWCELDMPPYSSRILVVNDGSFRLDIDSAEQATAPESSAENTEVFSIPEITLGKYRHFKGNEYEVVGFATHSETGEKLVIYKSLLDPDEVWARPIEMFGETVFRDGKQVPRFEKLG